MKQMALWCFLAHSSFGRLEKF